MNVNKSWRVKLLSLAAAAALVAVGCSVAAVRLAPQYDLSALAEQFATQHEPALQQSAQPACSQVPASSPQGCTLYVVEVKVSSTGPTCTPPLPSGMLLTTQKPRVQRSREIKLQAGDTQAVFLGAFADKAGTQSEEFPAWFSEGSVFYLHFQLPNS